MMNKIRNIEVKIRHTLWALGESLKPSQCYSVKYKGEEFCVKPAFNRDNCWHLIKRGDGKPTHFHIDGKDLKVNLHSFKRWHGHFKSMYRFQKTSWYSIDICKPFGTRISYINSDNIRF